MDPEHSEYPELYWQGVERLQVWRWRLHTVVNGNGGVAMEHGQVNIHQQTVYLVTVTLYSTSN